MKMFAKVLTASMIALPLAAAPVFAEDKAPAEKKEEKKADKKADKKAKKEEKKEEKKAEEKK